MPRNKWFLSLIAAGVASAPTSLLLGSSSIAQVNPRVPLNPGINIKQPKIDVARIKNFSLIRTQAQNKPVRVIMRLTSSSVQGAPSTTSLAPAPFVGLPAQKVLTAQNRVLSQARSLGLQGLSNISQTPLIVASVNAAGLDQIVQNGDIAEVYVDQLQAPTLDASSRLIHASEMWASGGRGQGQTVAILDTGVQSNHPLLAGRVVEEACYSSTFGSNVRSACPGGVTSSTARGSAAPPNSRWDHGTHVAGIAAGRAVSGTPLNGVAPEARILAIQVFSSVSDVAGDSPCADNRRSSPCPLAYTSDIIRGLVRVRDRARALNIASANLSLGGGRFYSACNDDPRRPIVRELKGLGVATVIASGNDGYRNSVSAPACIPEAIAVGATDDNDQVASYSNISSQVSLLAPGSSINSSVNNSRTGEKSGTSMATPQVAGAIAAYRSRNPGLSVDQMLSNLRGAGVPISVPGTSFRIPRLDFASIAGPGPSQACDLKSEYIGTWSFKNPATGKYARGGVTAEGRNDLVGALAPSVANPSRAWETFRLYKIPGVAGGRRLQNTIDGRWLETVNKTGTLLLHGPVRKCDPSVKDMQWKVVSGSRPGEYKLQNLRTNKFVRVMSNGLLKANASGGQATIFLWKKY